MKGNEYKCAICKGIFEETLTEEEAVEQLNEEFPGFTPDECDIVCDDCYKKHFGGFIRREIENI
jgi:hypothetical protein